MLFSADNRPKKNKNSRTVYIAVVRIPSPHTTIEVLHELKFIDKVQIYIQFLRGHVIDIWFC